MKKTILLLTLFAAILLPAANLIQNPATGQFRSGTVPEGITATIRNDAGFITVNGGNRQFIIPLPLEPDVRFLRLRMRMRATDIVPGPENWHDGRLAMRFWNQQHRMVGEWPEVFHASGTGNWIECDRIYQVPAGAAFLALEPANFGLSGKIEFADLRIEAVRDPAKLNRDVPPPDGMIEKELFSLADAWRNITSTRERICLNGLWQFHPVLPNENSLQLPPTGSGWGYFKVPGAWPVHPNGMQFYLSPLLFGEIRLDELGCAWYRREIEVPVGWDGRQILLNADMIQSRAKIFVDGAEVGDLYYPGGEADLTGKLIPGRKQTLSLLVSADPVVSGDFMAADRFHSVKSNLHNRGITGDLYLESRPAAVAISDVHIITSVRDMTITFDTGFTVLPAGNYRLEAELSENGKIVKHFLSSPFRTKGGTGSRRSFGGAWSNPKLWDTDAPENLYTARIRLLSANDKLIDEFFPQEFGFREFHIDGRDFFLNGRKIHLRALVSRAAQESDFGSPLWISHLAETSRAFGANFLVGWNYSFAPGIFCHLNGFHKGSSKYGLLTSLTLPHFKEFGFRLDDPVQAAAYRRQAEHLIRRYQNVPGVVMYVMSHNAVGYAGDQNPLRIGTAYKPEQALPAGSLSNRAQAVLAETIARELDPTRPIYHHAGGNLGDVYTVNCYLNWSPRQERADWLEQWEKNGVMPVFFIEWGLPHVASWSSFRGPAFIWASEGLQCLWTNEFNAAILGEKAYRHEPAKEKLYDHQERMIKGNRETLFDHLGGNGILNDVEDVNRVRAYYAERIFRSLRARNISGILPWDQFLCWSRNADKAEERDNPERFRCLKQPGVVPDRLIPHGECISNPLAEFRLNTTGKAVHAGFFEFLGWIGGKSEEITEEGHNYRPGETVRKTLVILNDSRRDAEICWRWRIPALGLEENGSAIVAPGGKHEQPVEFTVPAADAPGRFTLEAEFNFPEQRKQHDRFTFDIITPVPAKLISKVGLFDPEGKARPLLKRLGVSYRNIQGDADLNGVELLILGRNALRNFPLHLSKRLEKGLKLLVLEQPSSELFRLGLRSTEQGFREVFSLISGFDDLRDWRGSATQLPGIFPTPPFEATNPKWSWNGFDNTRVWRAGNRGSITEIPLEKPSVGNWNPLLQCGFDLQYTPLIEFTEGAGRIVFCQLAISGRTESEPQADELLRRALERLDGARIASGRKVCYAGGPEGTTLLDALCIPYHSYTGSPSPETLLVLGPGAKTGKLADAVAAGTNVLALGLGKEELEALLPGKFKFKPGSHNSDYVENLRTIPEFTGIGNAELHWRGKVSFDAFPSDSPGGRALGLVRHGKGVFAAVQLPPWKFDADEFYNRTTRRRSTYLISRLAANLGASFKSGFYALFDGDCGNVRFELPNDRWIGLADPERQGRTLSWMNPEFHPDAEWRPVRVPGYFDSQFKELENYDGLFWYRLEFELPPRFSASEAELSLGPVDDESWVWLNGSFLGAVTAQTQAANCWEVPRNYHLKTGLLKPGKNVLVVLCNDLAGTGGILGTPLLRIPQKYSFHTDSPVASDDPYRYYRW